MRFGCALAIALALALLAGPARAHEIVPGVTGLASLLLHPFVAVETVLLMLGLALVAGATERALQANLLIGLLLAGATAGVMLQPSVVLLPGLWRLPLVLALVLGALTAIGRRVPPPIVAGLALLVSLAIGIAIPPERPGAVGRIEVVAAVAAAILAVLLAIAVPRAALGHYRPVRLGAQILGAWIVAISLLGMAVWFR